MIVEPLNEAQKRVNAIHAALEAYRDYLNTSPALYRYALENLKPVFAALDGRDVANAEPVEPVAPIMQGFFWTRALDSSYRVHCATGHVLSWHATEAEAQAEVARRVAEARPWSTEQILQHEG